MATFRALYRDADGTLGPAEWLSASALPVGVAIVMTMLAYAISPGPRDLSVQPFFSVSIFAVHAYLLFYGFALFVLAVMEYFVSAKRLRDLGRAPGLAGLAPLALLLAGAAAWFQPRSEGAMPEWAVWPFYAVALAVVVGNVAVLGFVKR